MPNPSTLSRVFLGALLTVAIVLIIVVAASRPTNTGKKTPLLTAKGNGTSAGQGSEPAKAASESGSTADAVEPKSDDREPATGTDADIGRKDSTPIVQQDASGESPTTDAPPAKLKTSGSAKMDAATTEPEAPKRPDSKTPESASEAEGTPAKESPLEIARKSITGWDPLQRLSREFARRAAVRGSERAKPTPVAPPAHEIFPPTVVMSDAHRKSCPVFVEDAMPDATLNDQTGNEHSLRQSLGKRLTVVVFWNADNPYSLDQFEEMPNELAPFKELDVKAIAVHVGQIPDNYGELVERFGQDILCLADPARALYQKVASGPVPRTYVLDIEGKVIWLDIEYSRTTRYDLRNALHYSLQNGQDADGTESE